MAKYVVGTVDEIPPGSRKIIEVARRSIGVFNVKGTYYAIRNHCPHAGGPLCEGVTSGLVTSDKPGTYEYLKQGEILRCPWHGWEYEIATGQSWFDPERTRVRAYTTTVTPAAQLPRSNPELEAAGFAPGPYTMEMYDVEVDREFIVVSI
ncbi:Rieske (2Fe-2S) protein [Microlunatus speluncae]|jgi:3-phenylpropionate/trans-cinnamate dioxygenase ferredoxin subunit|uniref:Rieske (2Fe-2S) protein n=1 Tax=Microlunatus speluncae TaxID=2594267 RepID=UPI0012666657|nr:Rieske (2Fe-2S) protein [Microlunatus speluncae]